MYVVWAGLAASLAVGIEILFKRGFGWLDYWWLFMPLAMFVNFSIYKLVTSGPTLLLAIVAFTLLTVVMRSLASQFLLDEPVTRGNLIAAVALMAAGVVGHLWK